MDVFEELTIDASLTHIEEEVRRFWQRHGIPEAALALNPGGPAYVIAQQPLAAAGRGSAPATKAAVLATGDLLARYRRMQGDRVHHQIGWAGHGLAVEVAVERAAGPALRDYDLARFNAACESAAMEAIRHGETLAARLGVWSAEGGADTYVTLAPQSVEKVWAALKRLWDGGQFREELRVVPFCPRCATPLSATEAGRQVQEVDGLVAGVYLPWMDEPNGYLLVWTPLPWTLIGLAGVAAHPDDEYVVVEVTRGRGIPPARLLLAASARERLMGSEGRVVRRLRGKALRGNRYRPLFTFVPDQAGGGSVVVSDMVPRDWGSGLFPLVPGFDALSLTVATDQHLPLPDLTDETGRLGDPVTHWRGLSPIDAEPLLVQDLQTRGLLFHKHIEKRSQALCPYCSTALVPLTRKVWLAGEWIVSRDRAWGAPLPVWQCCDCGQSVCMPGLTELANRSGLPGSAAIVIHRPEIDRLALTCDACGGTMRRVAPVLDAALEAAVLPSAFSSEPGLADVAIGTGDREIGWLGDMGEVAALLHRNLAWGQALVLAEGDAAAGQSLDRLVAADAVRWAAFRAASSRQQARHGEAESRSTDQQIPPRESTTRQAERGERSIEDMPSPDVLRDAWALAFPPGGSPEPGDANARGEGWLRVRLIQQITRVTNALDACDPSHAAEELAVMIADLRTWQAANQAPLPAAALDVVSRLLAPFVPHLAEALYQIAGAAYWSTEPSVHLAGWPVIG